MESAVENSRPWTPSYSVTSQGSPMQYTGELAQQELRLNIDAPVENVTDDVAAALSEPTRDTEPASSVDVLDFTVKAEVAAETSTALVNEASNVEELTYSVPEGPDIHSGTVDDETEFKEQVPAFSETLAIAPAMLVTDTDEVVEESTFPQVSFFVQVSMVGRLTQAYAVDC